MLLLLLIWFCTEPFDPRKAVPHSPETIRLANHLFWHPIIGFIADGFCFREGKLWDYCRKSDADKFATSIVQCLPGQAE